MNQRPKREISLRRIVRIIGGGTPSSNVEFWDGTVPFATPKDLRPSNGGILGQTDRTITQEGLKTGSSLAPADSILLSVRAPIGYSVALQAPVAFSQGCKAIVPNTEQISQRFLLYTLQANRERFEAVANGTTFMELSATGIAETKIRLPDLESQARIVRFLDEETAKIDYLIEKYERLLELIVDQAETRWHQLFADLLTCPERPLKRVLQKVTRPAFDGEGVITAFRDGQVTLRANRREEGFTFSDTEDGYQGLEPGDLVYHGLDGFAGAVGVSDSSGNGSPVYHVCRPLDEQNNVHFLAAYLRFLGLSGFLATQAPNVRQRSVDFRNWDTFSRIPIRVPSRREQDEIVTRLEEFKTSRDTTELLMQKAIALLRERRSALVTAAVTGQIEI